MSGAATSRGPASGDAVLGSGVPGGTVPGTDVPGGDEVSREWLDREIGLSAHFHDIRGALTVLQGTIDLSGGPPMLSNVSERLLRLFDEMTRNSGLQGRAVDLGPLFGSGEAAPALLTGPVALLQVAVRDVPHVSTKVVVGPALLSVVLQGVPTSVEDQPAAGRLRVAARLCGALGTSFGAQGGVADWAIQFLRAAG